MVRLVILQKNKKPGNAWLFTDRFRVLIQPLPQQIAQDGLPTRCKP